MTLQCQVEIMDGSTSSRATTTAPDRGIRRRPKLSTLLFAKYDGDVVRVEAWFHKLAAVRRARLLRHWTIQRGRCAICATTTWIHPDEGVPSERATLEHVLPQSMGGTDHDDNLVMTCHPCNSGRGVVDIFVYHQHWLATGRRRMSCDVDRSPKTPSPKDEERRAVTAFGLATLFGLVPGLYEWSVGAAEAHVERGDEARRRTGAMAPAV